MSGRGKDKKKQKGPVANQIKGAAKPNTLSWTADDADAAVVEVGEDEFEDELDEELEDDRTDEEREAELQAELARQAEEFGLTRLEATDIYGANGEDVESVLEALKRIGIDRAVLLADAWDAADSPERDLVQKIVQQFRERGRHKGELSAVDSAIDTWLISQETTDDAALWAGEEMTRRVVALAARDAVHALILDEDLDDSDFDALYGPWYEVMDAESGAEGAEADAESDADAEADSDDAEAADEEEEDVVVDGPYGPNSALVADLLTRLASLSQEGLNSIQKFWAAADKKALKAAHKDLDQAVKEDRDWRDQVRNAQDKIVEWASPRASRQSVVPPLADCVAALVMADVLDPENAETLYAPWAEVVGLPALPKFEDTEAGE